MQDETIYFRNMFKNSHLEFCIFSVVKKDVRQKAAVKEQINLQTQEQELIKKTKEKEKEEALIQMGWQRPRLSVKITEIIDDKNGQEIQISSKFCSK